MTNKDVIDIIRNECCAVAPDRFASLNFAEAEKYKNTVPKVSIKKNYIAAAAIYAAACIVVLLIIPFIIGGGDVEPPVLPGKNPGFTDTTSVAETEKYKPDLVQSDDAVMNEFFAAFDRAVADGRIINEQNKEECVEVTPTDVYEETGARLFTFADTYYTYIYADGEVYGIPRNGQLNSVPGVVPCDYDGNGRNDLMLAVPWIKKTLSDHTTICVFDMETKTTESANRLLSGLRTLLRKTDDNGDVRYDVSDVTYFVDTDRRFVMIPVAGDIIYGNIGYRDKKVLFAEFDPVREKVLTAFRKGHAEGRLEEIDFWKPEVNIIGDADISSEFFAFTLENGYGTYVYCNGNVFLTESYMGAYNVYNTQICDMDKNGIDDLILYGSFGSGLSYYSITYFDSSMRKDVTLLVYPNLNAPSVYIEEKTDDNGEVYFELYTSIDEYYLGTVEYRDGKFTTDLICEGDITDAIKYAYSNDQ